MKHQAYHPVEEFAQSQVEPNFVIDFSDVFGGPPRMIFLRRRRTSSFFPFGDPLFLFHDRVFDEVDQSTMVVEPAVSERRRTQNLCEFVIPGSRGDSPRLDEGFYDEVFGVDGNNSETGVALSISRSTSQRECPRRQVEHDDMGLATLASRLKPINVRSQNSERPTKNGSRAEHTTDGNLTEASTDSRVELRDLQSTEGCKQIGCSGKINKQNSGFSNQSLHNQFLQYNQAMRRNAYDKFYYINPEVNNSPSSVTMSLAQGPESCMEMSDKGFRDDEGDTEIMANYVPRIVPEKRDETDVEDAIAWVKENCRTGPESAQTSECEQMPETRNSKSSRYRCEKRELNSFL